MTAPHDSAELVASSIGTSGTAERLARELTLSVGEHLRAHGHRVPLTLGLEPMLAAYFRLLVRRIARRPRPFVRSSLLTAGGSSERVLSERARGVLGAIERICEAGGDLNPFLHRRLFSEPASEDRMLRDQGLHHLHLGSEAPLRKTGLTRRSTEVLLGFVGDEGFFAVDVRLHGRKARLAAKRASRLSGPVQGTAARTWVVDDGLLEIAERHWPEALEASRRARMAAEPELRARAVREQLDRLVARATPDTRLVVGYSDFDLSSLSLA